MSTISLRIPEYLHEHVRMLAERERVSINQLVTLALAEKVAVLMAEDRIRTRAKRADRAAFKKVLEKVPDVEPVEEDRI